MNLACKVKQGFNFFSDLISVPVWCKKALFEVLIPVAYAHSEFLALIKNFFFMKKIVD